MLPLNPIWPPLDTPFGHNLVNACHYIGVKYKVFEGWQSISEVFCDNSMRYCLIIHQAL